MPSTNISDAVLSSYEDQIAQLKQQASTTTSNKEDLDAYDKSLDAWLAAIKQADSGGGDSATAHGAGSGSAGPSTMGSGGDVPSTTGSGGSGSSTTNPAATSGGSGATPPVPTPPPAASGTGSGSGSSSATGSGGGPAGSSGASGGGGTGGIPTTNIVLDPATQHTISQTANHAAQALGGGSLGAAAAASIERAGLASAATAAAAGATPAGVADAAIKGAQAASDAANAVLGAGGSAADAGAAAAAAADAAGFGGAGAAASVAQAAAQGGLDSAQAVSGAAEAAFNAGGGFFGGVDAINDALKAAEDALDAAKSGGLRGAQSVEAAAQAGGAELANVVATTVTKWGPTTGGRSVLGSAQDVINAGGSPEQAIDVAKAAADAANAGGPEAAKAVLDVVQEVLRQGGTPADAITIADEIADAAEAAQRTGATNETNTNGGGKAAQQAADGVLLVLGSGGSFAQAEEVAEDVIHATSDGGPTAAEKVVDAVQFVVVRNGVLINGRAPQAVDAADAATHAAQSIRAAGGSEADAAEAAEQSAAAVERVIAAEGSASDAASAAEAVDKVIQNSIKTAPLVNGDAVELALEAGDNTAKMAHFGVAGTNAQIVISQSILRAAETGGASAADAVRQATIEYASGQRSYNPVDASRLAELTADAAQTGGASGAQGILDDIPEILQALDRAERIGGDEAVNALFDATETVVNAGGDADDVLDMAELISEAVQTGQLGGGRDEATTLAGDVAEVVDAQAETVRDRGLPPSRDAARNIIEVAEEHVANYRPPESILPRPVSAPPAPQPPPLPGPQPPRPASAPPSFDPSLVRPDSPASSAGGLPNTLLDAPSAMDGGGPLELTSVVGPTSGDVAEANPSAPATDASNQPLPSLEAVPDASSFPDLIVLPQNPLATVWANYTKLRNDLNSNADQATIEKDAAQLAIVAGEAGQVGLAQVAVIIGSGGSLSKYGDNAHLLGLASPGSAASTLPTSSTNPLVDAYLKLGADIAGKADPQKIKADADQLTQLANGAGDTALASAASNISNSISGNTYDQATSLTALMDSGWPSPTPTASAPPPTSSAPPPPAPGPLVPPSDIAAYNKLVADIQSNADGVTILTDAAQLAIAAAGSGDSGLETAAHNIGNSIGGGTFSKDSSLSALTNAAPGTPGAQSAQGPALTDAAGSAYLKLESDVEHGADQNTVQADAEQVKALAQNDGNTNLVDAANAIITGISNGTYDQVGAEEALMNDGATPASSAGGPPSSDEVSAYQKLISDIHAGADNTTLLNDVLSLSDASIGNGDFGLGQAALDIGFSLRGGTFDPNAALQALTGAAPGTSAAQLPPITAPV